MHNDRFWNDFKRIGLLKTTYKKSVSYNRPKLIRDRSQTLVGGLIQKGTLTIFDPYKAGPWKKLTANFQVKIEFTYRDWPVLFMAKRGALNFLRFEGGPEKKFAIFFLHQAPLTSVCERSLRKMVLELSFNFPY